MVHLKGQFDAPPSVSVRHVLCPVHQSTITFVVSLPLLANTPPVAIVPPSRHPGNLIAGPYLLLSTHHYRCSAPAVDKCSLSNGCHHSKVLHSSHTTPPLSPLFGDPHGTQAVHSPPCPPFFDKQALPPPFCKATRKCPSRQPPCRLTKVYGTNLTEEGVRAEVT
nr:unnamed protein product [Digitaria exilis]